MHRVTISTFDKWLAKADEIAKVENGSSKHVRGRSKRVAYSKERPSDEKKGQLYDWLKAAPKPVNQADLRKEARRIWPEWCDMDHDDWKTPGNIRKFCSRFAERYFPTATDQQAQQHVDQLTAQQDEQQLNDQQAHQHVDQRTDQQAEEHVNELTDQQAGQHVDQLTDQQAHQHVDQLTDQQTETPFNQRTFGDILDEYPPNSDGIDATKRKRPRLNNDYESVNENEYGKGYIHIDQSMPLRGRTSKARPARLARYSSGSKYNSGIHNDRCYRCSRRTPCTDWRKCSNVDSRHECASDRFPKTTIVVDPTFGFGLRLDGSVPKDTKIIEYVGQLITKESYLCRKEKWRGQLAWYIARVSREDDNLYVDATKYGNASRFINHSCLPNCCFETWYVDKKPRLMAVSRLPLEKGCILSLHYMDSTWGIECQCEVCDGTYLPPPTDLIDD
ncbi:histone methyltransferase set2 [Aphanomyces cochlioides]|nr:histone methyltransferase set2 [Aphanomyces cochlioides]